MAFPVFKPAHPINQSAGSSRRYKPAWRMPPEPLGRAAARSLEVAHKRMNEGIAFNRNQLANPRSKARWLLTESLASIKSGQLARQNKPEA
jgi:hypothetical protein